MAIEKQHLNDAKKNLKNLKEKPEKGLTMKEFVSELIKDINSKMADGYSLKQVCTQLNEALPDDQKMKPNTFKVYVQQARAEKGIPPTRAYNKKAKVKPEPETVAESEPSKQENTETDFRKMGDI